MTPQRSYARVPALDGLRGAAVLLVIGYHAPLLAVTTGGVHRQLPLLKGGWLGVDIFFVLSGYLITAGLIDGIEEHSRPLRPFYARRLRRLGPAALVLLVVWLTFALSGLVPVMQLGDHPRAGGVWLSLAPVIGLVALGYNWWLAFDGPSPIGMGHLWSLTIEEQFYLVWPSVMYWVFRRSADAPRRLVVVCRVLAGVAVALSVIAAVTGRRDIAYFGTPTRMLGLVAGAYVALVHRRAIALCSSSPTRDAIRRAIRSRAVAAMLVGCLASMVLLASDANRSFVPLASTASAVAAALLLNALVKGKPATRRWFTSPWLMWCGRRSYALYLWDAPVVYESEHLLGVGWLSAIVATTVTFGCAILSWHLVERRFVVTSAKEQRARVVVLMEPAEA